MVGDNRPKREVRLKETFNLGFVFQLEVQALLIEAVGGKNERVGKEH